MDQMSTTELEHQSVSHLQSQSFGKQRQEHTPTSAGKSHPGPRARASDAPGRAGAGAAGWHG